MKIEPMKKTLGFALIMAGSVYCVKLYPQISYAVIEVDTYPSKPSTFLSKMQKREINRIEGSQKQFKLKGYKKWEIHRQGILIQRKCLEFKKKDIVSLSVYV